MKVYPARRLFHLGIVGAFLLSASARGAVPATGPVVPELRPFQTAMEDVMSRHFVNEGSLALMKDDKLVLRQGYGWRDHDHAFVMHPDNLFRLASVSKTLTMSAINKLIREGKINRETKVYAYLGIQPWGGTLGDPRIADITIKNLLDHRGGWTTGPTRAEAVFQTARIAKEMGLNHPATATDVIRWKFSKPLDAAPGATNVYSNLGYQILGRVIEKASGKRYVDYIQEDLLGPSIVNNPIGFKNVVLSHSPPQSYAPWEIWYAQEGHNFESFDSFGGLSASAVGLCHYMEAYYLGGPRRVPGNRYRWTFTFFGGLDGASTAIFQEVQQDASHTNSLEFAALFNGGQKTADKGAPSNDACDAIRAAAKDIASWPAEGGGMVEWSVPTTNISSQAASLTVQLTRSGTCTLPVKASYTTYSLSAGANCYTPTSGIISFAAGETNQPITVPILAAGASSGEKRFVLELISASGGAWLGNQVSCVVNLGNGKTASR